MKYLVKCEKAVSSQPIPQEAGLRMGAGAVARVVAVTGIAHLELFVEAASPRWACDLARELVGSVINARAYLQEEA